MFGFLRRFAFLALLPAAILIPYAMSNGGVKTTLGKVGNWFKGKKGDNSGWTLERSLDAATPAGVPVAHQSPYRASEANIDNLASVFRFDISPEWVTQHWHEVSTVSADLDLQGMRVALVTGTRQHDLAGSLTYYFDRSQKVQRISFYGSTGNADRLIDTVLKHYHLKRQPSLGAHLCVARWNGVITSAVLVTRPAKIRADAPLSQLVVQLELNRPSNRYGMSHQLMSRIKAAHDVGQW